MSIITISPALPNMKVHFSDVPNIDFWVRIVMTVPALIIAIIAPFAGRLIDRYGRLKLLWGALVLYGLSGLSGLLIDDIYLLLFSRVLLGVAVGTSMTIVITLVADYFEGMERQKFLGLQVAFMSVGGILFIGLGGFLADFSWRYPFVLYGLAMIVLPMSILFLKEPEKVIKVSNNQTADKAPKFLLLLYINTMIMWIIFFFIPVQVPFYLNEIGIEKASLIGAAIALSTAFSAISAISFSRIKNRISFVMVYTIGYLLMGLGFYILSLSNSYIMVVIAMIICGLGMGIMIPNTNLWVMKLVPLSIRGREIGKLTTFWFMGQFISPFILLLLLGQMSSQSVFKMAAIILVLLAIGFRLLLTSSSVKELMQES
ncbi:MAG: MFS family permease [Saprospiraceae bacterium]|jgi:MFS family permease